MEGLTVRVKVSQGASLPEFGSSDAAGADLRAFLPDQPVILASGGGRALIPTGLILEIPQGYEGQVRPRSGLAAKYGLTVLNSPGTIDSDYRGEVKIILINHGSEDFVIHDGDRIAQLVIAPVIRSLFIPTTFTSSTQRGKGGFGSTGV
ncbi:MAG: dUTP diphosphatase [Sphaerochaetaceae bacterium]|nr:dUTP diphosphatase [Sphaerochaetaceae bacterium]